MLDLGCLDSAYGTLGAVYISRKGSEADLCLEWTGREAEGGWWWIGWWWDLEEEVVVVAIDVVVVDIL